MTRRRLVSYGCDILCIGSNTVHILLDEIKAEVQTPFLSMVELVALECKSQGYHKVALFGTPVLIESGLYDERMKTFDIEFLKPNDEQEKVCDEVIRRIIAGKPINTIKSEYVSVLNAMFDLGAEAIVLGCTELPMVLNYETLGKKVIT